MREKRVERGGFGHFHGEADLGGDITIVCVPTEGDRGWDESVAGQFGRARTFTILDTSTNGVRVVRNPNGNGGKHAPSDHIADEKVEAVLAGKLSPDAISALRSKGILVFVGAEGTVLDTVASWRKGRLQRATMENSGED